MWRAHDHVVLGERINEGRDMLISNVGMIEEYATWRAHDHVVLCERIDEGRDVLISNAGMIEEYAVWRAHDHVVLGERIDEWRDVLISNVGMIEEYAMWRAHDHVVLGKRIDEGRDVLISNVGMIEEYAMWRAHDHVVLGERIDEGRAVLISNVRFFILCTTWPSCYDFHTHRHMSGGWSDLVYIRTEELPCKLQVWKAILISWPKGANSALHTPLWLYPTACHSCWPAIPRFTISSLEAQPLGRVPSLPLPPAAASSGYLNLSPKSEVCNCLHASADIAIHRWILVMALIREIHSKWDEMVAR
jgi:hypothetical protein